MLDSFGVKIEKVLMCRKIKLEANYFYSFVCLEGSFLCIEAHKVQQKISSMLIPDLCSV